MCGRYTLHSTKGTADKLKQRFHLDAQEFDDRYNVAPSQVMPVLAPTSESPIPLPRLMVWGFAPSWSQTLSTSFSTINARVESVFTKPLWRSAARSQRCLVPASGYFEWKKPAADSNEKTKTPFYIHPADEQEVFGFGGLWNTWINRETGESIDTYAMITVPASPKLTEIHHRMPLIINESNDSVWLDAATPIEIIQDLMSELPDETTFDAYPVTRDVGNPRNDFRKLIDRAG